MTTARRSRPLPLAYQPLARQRPPHRGNPVRCPRPHRLVEGAGVHGWKQALNALEIYFPGRILVDVR